jgi:hypothetical protein
LSGVGGIGGLGRDISSLALVLDRETIKVMMKKIAVAFLLLPTLHTPKRVATSLGIKSQRYIYERVPKTL